MTRLVELSIGANPAGIATARPVHFLSESAWAATYLAGVATASISTRLECVCVVATGTASACTVRARHQGFMCPAFTIDVLDEFTDDPVVQIIQRHFRGMLLHQWSVASSSASGPLLEVLKSCWRRYC